jgi:hypothetical protein
MCDIVTVHARSVEATWSKIKWCVMFGKDLSTAWMCHLEFEYGEPESVGDCHGVTIDLLREDYDHNHGI